MTSRCLDRRKYDTPSGEYTGATDRLAGGNTGRLFLTFGGPVCVDRISYCPLDRVLTYKNLIYLLNLQFTPYSIIYGQVKYKTFFFKSFVSGTDYLFTEDF